MQKLIADSEYNGYKYAIKQIIIDRYPTHSWYCCYVQTDLTFTDEELENLPVYITWQGPYANDWVESNLTSKNVIGWDYGHIGDEDTTINICQADVVKLIDYLNQTYGGD